MDKHSTWLRVFLGIISWVLAGVVYAQTDAEVNAGIQFDFSNPGARSLAMGGAFVALADDATAAFTNPAGLVELAQPEVSLEVRELRFENSFTDRGHAFGFVTGIGVDTVEGLRAATSKSDTAGFSFLSYVHTWRKGGKTRWALALYRHQLVSFEAAFETQGAFFNTVPAGGRGEDDREEDLIERLLPVLADFDLEIVNVGLSAGYRVSDDFRLGFGVSAYDFEIDSLQRRFSLDGIDPLTREVLPRDAPGALFGPSNFSPENENDFQEQIGSDRDVGWNVGFLWHFSELWWLGAVYRQGPEFTFQANNRIGTFRAAPFPDDNRGDPIAEQTAHFNVPDVWALGLAFHPSETMSVAFDYNRVEYSTLTEGLISIFEPEEFFDDDDRAALAALTVDDGDVYRLGFEYFKRNRKCPASTVADCAFSVRLGSWYDPDHKVRFGDDPGLGLASRSQAIQFLGGDAEVHFSAGLGFVFWNRFRIDAAADFAETVDTVSLSAVFYFGG